MPLAARDHSYLRDLATQVAEIAADPYNEERRQWWFSHNDLKPVRPMVLTFPEGSWAELLPHDTMRIADPFWREQEWQLRHKIYRWEHLRDDNYCSASTIEVRTGDIKASFIKHYPAMYADDPDRFVAGDMEAEAEADRAGG